MNLRDKLFKSHLEDGEKINFIAHRTIVVLGKDLIKYSFLGILIPLCLFLFIPQVYPLSIIWGIIGAVKITYSLFNWYFDAWLITNQAIIDIQWDGPFTRSATRIEYNNLGGVTYEVKGFIATILNYGDIHITDLGSAKISLFLAKRPKLIENKIVEYQEKFLSKQNFQDHDKLKNLLTSMVREHIRTHGVPDTENIKREMQ